MSTLGIACTLIILAAFLGPSFVHYYVSTTPEYKSGFNDYPDDSTYNQILSNKDKVYIFPDGVTRYCLGYEHAIKEHEEPK